MNEIELTSVLTGNEGKHLESTLIDAGPRLKEESHYVNTRYGKVFVTIQGNREKTPFLTFPDIGLNSYNQFHGFFNYVENEPLMESFCAYHVNPFGQEDGSPTLPTNYSYPSLDQLAETVLDVYNHFKLKAVICFGIGLGANVLSRFSLMHPDLVNGVILINCCSTKCGWVEWGYQKWNRWYLSSGQYTEFTNNYLLWHHFGYQTWEKNHDLIETYSRVFSKLNPVNLSHLINAYINRTDLGIQRNDFENEPSVRKYNFKCSVLNVMGDHSPHEDDVVETNGRLDPTKSSFVKFADCGGMILEEQPAKMCESLRHYLQGLGYVPHLSITRHSIAYRHSELAIKQKDLLKRTSMDYGIDPSNAAITLDDTKSFAKVPNSINA